MENSPLELTRQTNLEVSRQKIEELKLRLSFLQKLSDDEIAELIEKIEQAKRDQIPIGIIAGGTPFCVKDGAFYYGAAKIEKGEKGKVVKEGGRGPSIEEITTLENGVAFAKFLEAEGIPYLLAIPYFDTQTSPEERKKAHRVAAKNSEKLLPDVYKEIVATVRENLYTLFSSQYTHGAKRITDRLKRVLVKGKTSESGKRRRDYFRETGAVTMHVYPAKVGGEPIEPPHHILVSTPGSRDDPPLFDFDDYLDAIPAMRELSSVLIEFEGRTHCGAVTAGCLVKMEEALRKKFKVKKEKPIFTFTFSDCTTPGNDLVGVNSARAFEIRELEENPNSYHLFLAQKGEIERLISSQHAKNARQKFLGEMKGLEGVKEISAGELKKRSSGEDLARALKRLNQLTLYEVGGMVGSIFARSKMVIREFFEERGEEVKAITLRGSGGDRDTQERIKREQSLKLIASLLWPLIATLDTLNLPPELEDALVRIKKLLDKRKKGNNKQKANQPQRRCDDDACRY